MPNGLPTLGGVGSEYPSGFPERNSRGADRGAGRRPVRRGHWRRKKLLDSVQSGQRVCVFTCGVSDPEDERNRRHIRSEFEKRFGARAREIALFHVRGALDYGRLNPVHRTMMAIMRRMLLNRPEEKRTPEDEQLLATYGSRIDFVSRAQIAPVEKWVLEAARSI